MSTRSFICLKKGDDYKVIYCHWDGYPSNNGMILKNSYTNVGKINELLELGDISSLGNEIGVKHNFEDRIDGWTTAYGRDRGETDIEARTYHNIEALISAGNDYGTEYVYIFENNEWKCYNSEWERVEITDKDD